MAPVVRQNQIVDGHLRGYSTTDGKVIFDFDAMGPQKTVNEVPARGG